MTSLPSTSLARPSLGKIVAWFALPLFFIIGFPLAYVGASHAPVPLHMQITIVGPEALTSPVAESLRDGDEFTVTVSNQTDDARQSVERRDAVGSILLRLDPTSSAESMPAVTAYIASAEGRSTTATIQAVAETVARDLGTSAKIVEVAPLAEEDPLGTNLFYLLLFSSIGGYLVIITISELWGRSGRVRLIGAAITAVATPPLVFALSSIVVATYGADAGTIAKLLLVDALYVFTCALASILAEQLVGPAITIGVITVVVFLNFPSSGGTTAASLLPPFWQAIHEFWFGAGALESFRSIIYFGGAGASRWILQLAAWAVVLLIAIGLIELRRSIALLRGEFRASQGLVVAPTATAAPHALKPAIRIAGVIALPLFFIVCFLFAYLTALHAPAPNNMPIVIAGSEQATGGIVDAVEQKAGGAFDFTRTTDASVAEEAVRQREADGAIVIDGTSVTTYIANGGGRLAAGTVQSLGAQIADSLGGTSTIVDVAPLAAGDLTGTGMFYLLIVCTVGGYLTINALQQTFPRARLRTQLALVAAAAIVVPTVMIAVESIFVGIYQASVGQAWALWAIAVLYTATVAMLATLLARLLGTASTFGITAFILALNFPSSGGAVSASMMPGFWQVVHGFWFGSAALEAMRSTIYFDGAQVGQHLLVLTAWAIASTTAVLIVRTAQLHTHFPAEPSGQERELTLPGVEAAASSI